MFLFISQHFIRILRCWTKIPTPHSTLIRAKNIAESIGIKYCYVGNVNDSKNQSTYCGKCESILIKRDWHQTKIIDLKKIMSKLWPVFQEFFHKNNSRTKWIILKVKLF